MEAILPQFIAMLCSTTTEQLDNVGQTNNSSDETLEINDKHPLPLSTTHIVATANLSNFTPI